MMAVECISLSCISCKLYDRWWEGWVFKRGEGGAVGVPTFLGYKNV